VSKPRATEVPPSHGAVEFGRGTVPRGCGHGGPHMCTHKLACTVVHHAVQPRCNPRRMCACHARCYIFPN
jgi:hypothetical protein